MASKPPGRLLQSLTRRPRPCWRCANFVKSSKSTRRFSTTVLRMEENDQVERPRWSYTPEQMVAPFVPRIKNPNKAWRVNEDPVKVDKMYIKFLGNGGDKVLTDEIKWLALTHKSFDHGRRGFNDRLAFLGKRLLTLQGTLRLVHSPLSTATQTPLPDPYGRTPFEHPALEGLKNLQSLQISDILSHERLGRLAASYGIGEVTRWKPKNPVNLQGSGRDVVFSLSLFAILGAVALQKGGDLANKMARDRVLQPLGL